MSVVLLSLPCHVHDADSRSLLKTADLVVAMHPCILEYAEDYWPGVATCDWTADVTDEAARRCFDHGRELATRALRELDEAYGPAICESYGWPPVKVFHVLYDYLLGYDAGGLLVAWTALEKLLSAHCDGEVHVYRDRYSSLMKDQDNVKLLCDRYSHHNPDVPVVWHECPGDESVETSVFRSALTQKRHWRLTVAAARKRFQQSRLDQALSRSRAPEVVLAGAPYEVAYVVPELENAGRLSVAEHREDSEELGACRLPGVGAPEPLDHSLAIDEWITAVVKHVALADFRQHGAALGEAVAASQTALSATGARTMVWGNPPACGAPALFSAVQRERGVRQVGMQHGSGYGVQECGYHYESDYSRFDDFFTFGFEATDLVHPLDSGERMPAFHPLGSPKLAALRRRLAVLPRRSIRVLYPLNNALSIWQSCKRARPSMLHEAQRSALTILDEFDGDCLVKTFGNLTEKNCSVLRQLRASKRLQVDSEVTYVRALEMLAADLIVLDTPSTPLIESLMDDVPEIIVLDDPVSPISQEARVLLGKRVHLCTTVEEWLEAIRAFAAGSLPTKPRDQSFLKRHLLPTDNPATAIADVIHGF